MLFSIVSSKLYFVALEFMILKLDVCTLLSSLHEHCSFVVKQVRIKMRHDMRFPTMWYVRPAQAQTSLRIRTI